HVGGVEEQRQRVGDHPDPDLHGHEGEDQDEHEHQAGAVGVPAQGMAVSVCVSSMVVGHAPTIRRDLDRLTITGAGRRVLSPAMTRGPGHEHALSQQRTTLVSIAVAGVLVAIKLGVGLATGSLGLISAGIESSGDVIAAVLTFFAVRLGGRPADYEHPYGHRRAENLGALGEAAILLAGGVLVSVDAIEHLLAGGHAPGIHWYQFAVIALAIALDLSRTSVSRAAARRFDSPALRANAFHFAGDMAGSLAVLAGLLAGPAAVALPHGTGSRGSPWPSRWSRRPTTSRSSSSRGRPASRCT